MATALLLVLPESPFGWSKLLVGGGLLLVHLMHKCAAGDRESCLRF